MCVHIYSGYKGCDHYFWTLPCLWECWEVHGIASEAHFQLFIFAPTGRPSLFGAGRRVRRTAEVKIKSRCGSPQCVPTTWLCLWECWEVAWHRLRGSFPTFHFRTDWPSVRPTQVPSSAESSPELVAPSSVESTGSAGHPHCLSPAGHLARRLFGDQ